MTVTVKQLEEELERKRTETAELEIVIRWHRRLEGSSNNGTEIKIQPEPPSMKKELPATGGSFSGKTMRECAEIILAEKGTAVHYKDVGAEAISRGYQSPRGGSVDAITQSFWATMSRTPECFRKEGKGSYSLVQTKQATDVE